MIGEGSSPLTHSASKLVRSLLKKSITGDNNDI